MLLGCHPAVLICALLPYLPAGAEAKQRLGALAVCNNPKS